jgi:hypothetical protein
VHGLGIKQNPRTLRVRGFQHNVAISERELDLADVLGLRTLGAVGQIKLDPVALIQALETVALNGGIMHEHIAPTVLRDKTKTLLVLEPLHSSLRHFCVTSRLFLK